jgi:hypothetical protein
MNRPYNHYNPNQKQAFDIKDYNPFTLKGLNPTEDQLKNYALWGGTGAGAGLGLGAGVGALINLLRDESVLKGALVGGGAGALLGGGLGAGAKAYLDSNTGGLKDLRDRAKKDNSVTQLYGYSNPEVLENIPLWELMQYNDSVERGNYTKLLNFLTSRKS